MLGAYLYNSGIKMFGLVDDIDLVVSNVLDYYPYGKVLREYSSQQEQRSKAGWLVWGQALHLPSYRQPL